MKKYILIIFLFLMLTFSSHSQSFWDNITISTQFAGAHHDKRVFISKESLLREQPEKWGTWQYGVSIQKEVIDFGLVSMKIGIGYTLENMNFTRIIDHCYDDPDGFCTTIVVRSDNYNVQMVQVPVSIGFELFSGLQANVAVMPFFDWRKVAKYKGDVIFENSDLGFYSLEINPGLRYEFAKFNFGLSCRVWQWKKIDRVLFSERTIPNGGDGYPILKNTYEHYNPVKLWFSLGYRLGGDQRN